MLFLQGQDTLVIIVSIRSPHRSEGRFSAPHDPVKFLTSFNPLPPPE